VEKRYGFGILHYCINHGRPGMPWPACHMNNPEHPKLRWYRQRSVLCRAGEAAAAAAVDVGGSLPSSKRAYIGLSLAAAAATAGSALALTALALLLLPPRTSPSATGSPASSCACCVVDVAVATTAGAAPAAACGVLVAPRMRPASDAPDPPDGSAASGAGGTPSGAAVANAASADSASCVRHTKDDDHPSIQYIR
jgi:hypothetical protein